MGTVFFLIHTPLPHFSIMHLICASPPPKFCITFVFHFSWVLQLSQEELKPMLMQNFLGQIRFIMGNVAVAYQSENTGIGWFFGDHKILLFITQILKYHIDELYYICS